MRTIFRSSLLAIILMPIKCVFAQKEVSTKKETSAYVLINFDKAYAGDTLFIQFWPEIASPEDYSILNGKLEKNEYRPIINKDGSAVVIIHDIQKHGYFYLSKDFYPEVGLHWPLVNLYLLDAGDSIRIDVKSADIYPPVISSSADLNRRKYTLTFSGTGSAKFEMYHRWTSTQEIGTNSQHFKKYVQPFSNDGELNYNSSLFENTRAQIDSLSKFKDKISRPSYNIMTADLIGEYLYKLARNAMRFNYAETKDTAILKSLSKLSLDHIINDLTDKLPLEARSYSKNYAQGIYNLEETFFKFNHFLLDEKFYSLLIKKYSGGVRDKLLMTFLLRPIVNASDLEFMLKDALATIQNVKYKEKIKEVSVKLKGAEAYNFQLTNLNNKQVFLTDFDNKVIFMDFYFRGCSGCTLFYKNVIKDVETKFEGKNVVFLSVCVEAEKASWIKAMSSGLYTSNDTDNLINLYTNGMGYTHPLLKYYNIEAYPCAFVISKNKRIFSFDETLRTKDNLIAVLNAALAQ